LRGCLPAGLPPEPSVYYTGCGGIRKIPPLSVRNAE